MTKLRVLVVDDEPDIREVIEISLSLDPELSVRTCSSGTEAIAVAGDWSPDLVLLDVMMPGMDGPSTLARLREGRQTRDVPIIFMTARTQTREIEGFLAIGAEGVIAKPFEPLTLAGLVRSRMRVTAAKRSVAGGFQPEETETEVSGDGAGVAAKSFNPPGLAHDGMLAPDMSAIGQRERFLTRARTDGAALLGVRDALAAGGAQSTALERIQAIAHRLAGGAGVCGMDEIGAKAFALEEAATARLAGAVVVEIPAAITALIEAIDRASAAGERARSKTSPDRGFAA